MKIKTLRFQQNQCAFWRKIKSNQNREIRMKLEEEREEVGGCRRRREGESPALRRAGRRTSPGPAQHTWSADALGTRITWRRPRWGPVGAPSRRCRGRRGQARTRRHLGFGGAQEHKLGRRRPQSCCVRRGVEEEEGGGRRSDGRLPPRAAGAVTVAASGASERATKREEERERSQEGNQKPLYIFDGPAPKMKL